MIKQQVIIIRWRMVIIQNLLKSTEVLFSVEYIIPPLIIDGVFAWLFPIIWVISMYYYIVDLLFYIHPTITLQCVSFTVFTPFSLTEFTTDIQRLWQGFISFHVRYPYPLFYPPRFCVHYTCPFRPPLHIKHDTPSLKTHTISLSFLLITYLFAPTPLIISRKRSYLQASWTSKPT